MNLQLAVFYSLLTALLWGVGPVLYKKFYERFSSYFGYLVDAAFGSTLVLLPYALIGRPDYAQLPAAMLMTGLYSVSYLMFLIAFEFGKASLVSVITQTYPIYTIVLALSVGGERLLPFQLGLVISILLASILVSAVEEGLTSKAMIRNLRKPWFVFALLTSLVIGVGDYLLNESVEAHNVYTATLAIYLSQLVVCLALSLALPKRIAREFRKLRVNRAYLWSGLPASLAMSLGAPAFYKAFDHGPAALVSTVSSVSPIFVVLFASLWLKERVSALQFLLVFVIVGLVAVLSQ